MLCLFILVNIAWVSAYQLTDDTTALRAWVSLLVSRGVYVLLASLIALCFLVTTVRKKLEERAARNKTGNTESWTSVFWKKSKPLTLPVQFGPRSLLPPGIAKNDYDSLCDRIKEAEVTIISLNSELNMANKVKIDLENTLELFERQKNCSEDELLRFKIDGALELEALKKKAVINERRLGIVLEERDSLARDVESLKREGRITESAIKDQINLTKRLEKARTEIEYLKVRIKDMKSERDLAVKLASDMIEKTTVPTTDCDQKRVIELMIKAEATKLRLEEDVKRDEMIQDESYTNQIFKSDHKIQNKRTESDCSINDPSIMKKIRQNLMSGSDNELYSNENIDSLEENKEDDDSEDKKFLTGSPAFRAFLSSLSLPNLTNS